MNVKCLSSKISIVKSIGTLNCKVIISKLKSSKKFNIRWSLVRINDEDQGPYLELVKQNLETDAHN